MTDAGRTTRPVEGALEASRLSTYLNPEVGYTSWLLDTLERNFGYRDYYGESTVERVDWWKDSPRPEPVDDDQTRLDEVVA